jgi:hypothetical protein
MATENPDLQVLLINGDLVGHGVPMEEEKIYSDAEKDESYALLKQVLSDIAGYVRKYFPNAIVLPTTGNNDTMVHY